LRWRGVAGAAAMAVAPARFRARMTGQYGRKDPAGLVNGDDAKPLRGPPTGRR